MCGPHRAARRFPSSVQLEEDDEMPRRSQLVLLLCTATVMMMIREGDALRCYKCADYTGRCHNVQECTYEDACLSLSERGGKTIRQCIRYTDCDNSRLSQMFPAMSAFTYRCCSSNLCNSSKAVTLATPITLLIGSLLCVLVCWL